MAYSHLTTFLYTITLLKISLASDALLPNQTIANGQTLVSQNQIFMLGFFSPGSSRNVFLGIWYKNTPEVVVWVANRNNPIRDSQGLILSLDKNGTLVIIKDARIIWWANLSRVAINPVLQLLETGNLVIVDDDSKASSKRSYLWQSFDYPTDTRLPGMQMVDSPNTGQKTYLTSWRSSDDPSPGDCTYRILNMGLPQMVILRGTVKIYRSGNGLYLSRVSPAPDPAFRSQMVFNKDVLLSIGEAYNSSIVTRMRIEQSGLLHRYTMSDRKDSWNLVHTIPRDSCDNYGQCGPYSVCSIQKVPICQCLKGFAPKSQQQWDWSSGCERVRPLNCETGDGFLGVEGVKLPDMLTFRLNSGMSLGECRAECLKNCNCTAYANPYVLGGGVGCLMWFGDLVDIREINGAYSKQIVYIRLPVSELESNNNVDAKKKKVAKKTPQNIILILTAAGVLISCMIYGGILIKTKLNRRAANLKNEDLELPSFKLATIAAATNNFSSENMIGEGGFGPVFRETFAGPQLPFYRGRLSSEEVAVKRLSQTSGQGLEEFENEVILIAKLQHRNLVRLLGCCIEGDDRLLIYEYMKNRSLDYFIFDENRRKLLTWPKRFDLIIGISRGLLYLHHDSRLKIIHRDLKTSNILLDENFNPKISDFGLARTFRGDQTTARTRRVIGTYGYMAPEYAIDGKFSIKSDIFSLGVVLLEIVSGKKNRNFSHCNHHHSLLGHAWLLWKENRTLKLMDECLKDTCNESQVKRCIQIGLLCIQKFQENRPAMSSVLFMLGSEGVILPDPKEPGFFFERSSSNNEENHISKSEGSNHKNSLTITDLEPR